MTTLEAQRIINRNLGILHTKLEGPLRNKLGEIEVAWQWLCDNKYEWRENGEMI